MREDYPVTIPMWKWMRLKSIENNFDNQLAEASKMFNEVNKSEYDEKLNEFKIESFENAEDLKEVHETHLSMLKNSVRLERSTSINLGYKIETLNARLNSCYKVGTILIIALIWFIIF